SAVPAPPSAFLPVFALGALWLILWQGRWRWGGVVAMLVATGLWAAHPRPDLLIASSGGLVGILTPEGRGLSRGSGEGFVAENWLQNDGSRRLQAEVTGGFQLDGRQARGQIGGLTLLAVR